MVQLTQPILHFALVFQCFRSMFKRLGSPATSAAHSIMSLLPSVSSTSSTSCVCVGSDDGAGSFWSERLLDTGSSRGTIFSSHQGYLL